AVLAAQGVHLGGADRQVHVAVGDDAGEPLGDPGKDHRGSGIDLGVGHLGLPSQERPVGAWLCHTPTGVTPRRVSYFGVESTLILPSMICCLYDSTQSLVLSSILPPEVA